MGARYEAVEQKASQRGLLTASGIVAGEALIGILIAVLIVFFPSVRDAISSISIDPTIKMILGLGLFLFLCHYLLRVASSTKEK